MNKVAGSVLVVAGIVLLVLGVQASHSAASSVSKFFTGSPTDKALWMILGGVAAVITGAALSRRGD